MTGQYPQALRPLCIIGLGLIGGSLLRDAAAADATAFGHTLSRSGARQAERDGFDVSTDLTATLERAAEVDALIVIATPMSSVAEVLDAIVEHAPTCGITDVVSVKRPVYDLVVERGLQARYVGGHPMAGTEHSGWSASQAGLFRRAAWAVTYDWADELDRASKPVPQQWADLFTQVCLLAALAGAEAVPVSGARHDEAVARVSHLPHVVAEALSIVGDKGDTLAQSLAAGSFKGATRVAGTSPELVRNMVETNAKALVPTIDELIELLRDARDSLAADTPDMAQLAEAGNRAYTRFTARSGARRESVSPVRISSRPVVRVHPGSPHWVRDLKQIESLGARVEVF
ncbi:prephenate dehydrogenase [Corynebacterium timonense]|uniref:Prephenate dehydrogenase n=1 Tax=Corynebacterium timonense TaxID=441500 RepID=A0A1H1TS45_9CORY|nr:prephenate dehydrogenase [Corynebacterium timonense]SDS63038.1 prephenate dehydrogenase [Corynebacterium timonense]